MLMGQTMNQVWNCTLYLYNGKWIVWCTIEVKAYGCKARKIGRSWEQKYDVPMWWLDFSISEKNWSELSLFRRWMCVHFLIFFFRNQSQNNRFPSENHYNRASQPLTGKWYDIGLSIFLQRHLSFTSFQLALLNRPVKRMSILSSLPSLLLSCVRI